MPGSLDEQTWDLLIDRIGHGRFTPFLGAGASFPFLPLGGQVANALAQKYGYPFPDTSNLVGVAQYAAIHADPLRPKEDLLEMIQAAQPPTFKEPGQPHAVLAELPIPVYLTTNYDDFMSRALKRKFRDARQEYCRWSEFAGSGPSVFDSGYVPTVANPIVYHLHGFGRPETMVLTEDDYLEFLTNMTRRDLLPPAIAQPLGVNTCAFIGYGFADWNFKILFQALRSRLSAMNVVVVYLPPDALQAEKQRRYFERQYDRMGARVYWGTATEFCAELRQRWNAAQ
jgi:hypothetical protein